MNDECVITNNVLKLASKNDECVMTNIVFRRMS